ncbi:MAG: hypothetical protein BM485_14570 [Desulfobulbaceae bacterium DB1]|nr:MAG: hypothetical protein BM485_14570 [Desulfobulbaceae bacterium DB1]
MKSRRMMQDRTRNIFWLAMLLGVVTLALPGATCARELVGGRYVSSAGVNIVLELDIKSAAAGNLIVHQFFPAGITMVKSSPPAMKFDNGKAKWLIKKVQPGTLRIAVELSGPIPPGEVRAEVRCRDQETGKMLNIAISP